MNTHEEKLAKFQNLMLMAFADGKLAETEKDRLSDYIDRFGLTPTECLSIIESRDELNFIIPEGTENARLHLQELISMMLADEQIAALEYERCLAFARQAHISRQDLDRMISESEKNK